MAGPLPFDLPAPVLDAATTQLVDENESARRDALARLLAAHPEHRQGLLALWAALEGASRVLTNTFVPPPTDAPPQLPGYRGVQKLGEGAFGVVYLCEQHEPIHRQVALKLLRPGAGDRATLARFQSERRFLARLHHPTIAQIYDAGLLADGRPWFAMEYVPGVPITAYCDRARLPIEARLRLFARLCQGVQHAHDQGIVHRDLKPTNILVIEIDGEAQPKIIDFGIARAIEQPAEGTEIRTETGRVVGTPGYMSPEQANGLLDEIDERSDLFSLGVVLYELLAGELPWGKRPESTASDPQRPSQRVGSDPASSTTIAEQRGSQPRKLRARLRGDLDWIVLKALSRERERRYGSALELAAEIHRHLRGETVHAGPPSLAYRLRKFAARHRGALAATAAIAVIVAVGWWQLTGYRAEASNRGKDAAAAVASLLARANDKGLVAAPRSATVRKTLAQDALAFYDQFLRDHPADPASREGRARTLWTLSQVHWLLGQYAEAEHTGREAVADSAALLATAPDNPTYRCILANAERNLGRALFSVGQPAAARPFFQQAVDRLEACRVQGQPAAAGLLVRALIELHSTLDPEREATARADLLRRASEIQSAILAERPDDRDERDTLATIELQRCAAALERNDPTTAQTILARVERWLDEGSGLLPGNVVGARWMAARLAGVAGDLVTATARTEQAMTACRAWVAAEPTAPLPLNRLGSLLINQAMLNGMASRPDAALANYRDAVTLGETWTTRFPEDRDAPLFVAQSTHYLEWRLLGSGRRSDLADAERSARRACELLSKLPGSVATAARLRITWSALGTLGLVGDALGLADADAVWNETAAAITAWRVRASMAPPDVQEYLVYAVRIARSRIGVGRDAEAGTLLDEAIAMVDACRATVPDLGANAPELWRLRALLAANRGDFAAAADHADAALAAGDDFRAPVAAADAMSKVWLAAAARDVESAVPYRQRALQLCRQAIDDLAPRVPGDPDDLWVVVPLARIRIRLAQAQRQAGEPFDTDVVEDAVATLAAVRADAHAIEWDEAAYREGNALLGR